MHLDHFAVREMELVANSLPIEMNCKVSAGPYPLCKCPPDTCILIFESHLSSKNPDTRKGIRIFGARDGTRTHTALTTRTSNVLVYHSNTLASANVL